MVEDNPQKHYITIYTAKAFWPGGTHKPRAQDAFFVAGNDNRSEIWNNREKLLLL